jgi:hypothetical protein
LTPPAQPDLRGTPQQPVVVDTIAVKTSTDMEEADRAERQRGDLRTFWLGVATLAVLVVQAGAFIVQARRLRQSVDEMKHTTAATLAAATAEQQTVATMDATARRQLRAYVFVLSARIKNLTDLTRRPEPQITFKNYGQTPAYKTRFTIGYGWGTSFAELPEAQPETNALGPLGPGATFEFSGSKMPTLSPTQLHLLETGQFTLFVYGAVRYEDAFRRQRYVNFRVMTGGRIGLQYGDQLYSCEEGNDTDEPD